MLTNVPRKQSPWQNLSRLAQHFRSFIRKYRSTLSVVEGEVKSSQKELTLMLSGTGPDKSYITNLIFGDSYTEKYTRTLWQWELKRFVSQENPDLLIAINPKGAIAHHLRDHNTFNIPIWVRGELDFSVTSASQKKISIKADLSKIKKNHLSYIVTKDPKLFDFFYYEMHVPHTSQAHGKAAHTVTYEEMQENLDSSDLFLVKKDDEYIAGGIILYKTGRARAWANGVKDGNPDYVKMGALSALYYFNFLHLEKNGFKNIHIGSSKAFLNDGVLQYKKKWGMRLTGTRGGHFVVSVLKFSEGAKSFLTNNPFIQSCDNELTGTYFFDSDKAPTEEQLRKIYKRNHLPGMNYLRLHPLTKMQETIKIPDDLKDNIRVDAEQ